jgi:hypothetical protein
MADGKPREDRARERITDPSPVEILEPPKNRDGTVRGTPSKKPIPRPSRSEMDE